MAKQKNLEQLSLAFWDGILQPQFSQKLPLASVPQLGHFM